MDWVFGHEHDLSKIACQESIRHQLQEACFLTVAMDCSTKSTAREIKRATLDGASLPKPLRSEQFPERLPRLSLQDQQRVCQDNLACAFIVDQVQLIVEQGGGSIRENPTNSLHWHLPQEKRLKVSVQFWETEYDSGCWGGARCKRQTLKHNVEEINRWPTAKCHDTHHPREWEPVFCQGRTWYPRKRRSILHHWNSLWQSLRVGGPCE